MAEDVRRIALILSAQNKTAGDIASFEKGMGRVSRSVNKVSSDLARMAGIAGGTYLISRGLRESVTEFASFEKQLSMISTMLDEQTMHYMPAYSKQLRTMSIQFAEGTETLSKGTYDILSASIAAAKAMDTLAVSTIAAKAGFTDTAISGDAITTILNSYSIGAERAGNVSDKLFAIVKRGKTTYAELAPNIGKVAALASTAGESFDDLGASIATMTRAGVSTEITMTSIRAILLSFLKPQADSIEMAKKYKVELNSQTLKTIGLTGVIEKLKNATAEELAIIVPTSRAITGFAAAVQNATGLARDKELMLNSLGLTMEAYAKATDNLSFDLDQMNQILTQTKVIIGSQLAPTLRDNMYPVLKATITAFGYMASGIYTVREALRSMTGAYLLAAGHTATATASIIDSMQKLYDMSPQKWINEKLGVKVTSDTEALKRYGEAMIELSKNMGKEVFDNMLNLPSVRISKGFEELDKLIEDSKKLQVTWSKGGEIEAAGGGLPGTEGAAAQIEAARKQMAEARKLMDAEYKRRDQINQAEARMYEDMGDYGIEYQRLREKLLAEEVRKFKAAKVDEVLLEEWKQNEIRKINILKDIEGEDFAKGFGAGVSEMQDELQSLGGLGADLATTLRDGLVGSLTDAVFEARTLKEGLQETGQMMARMAFEWAMMQAVTGGMGLLFPAAGKHGGGMGYERPSFTEMVPASVLARAPSLHGGSNEYYAKLRRDEGVFTPGQMKNLAPAGGSPAIHIKSIIVRDEKEAYLEAMNSSEGEKVIIQKIAKNRRILG